MEKIYKLILILFLWAGGFSQSFVEQSIDRPDPSELQRWEEMAKSVTIYRDSYGVPHIFGLTDASVIFGSAYVRMEDRFREIEPRFHKINAWLQVISVCPVSPCDNIPTLPNWNFSEAQSAYLFSVQSVLRISSSEPTSLSEALLSFWFPKV